MTEIIIRIDNQISIAVTGHAGQAEKGRDIVCSAVSTLTYTAAQMAAEYHSAGWLEKEPNIKLESGDAEIAFTPKHKRRMRVLDGYKSIVTGYRLIAESYPDYVKLITHMG